MRYDFSNLSGLDFEELVHDLLEDSWAISLEIFKAGRDGGVDLRALQGDQKLIVQCKNYANTSFATLKARLAKEELDKIRALNPTRYVLVTSLPLTVAQKDSLVSILSPFVQSSEDVIDGTKLERMLEGAPTIVKRHHKLWLTSVPVLERILHAAEHEQTKAHIERVARKLPLFVQTRAYGRALETLESRRIVIVSGAPGIGKTTLADMLLYAHVSDGFTPAIVRNDLAEGRRLASGGGPMIFHFLDFLGQTFLGDRPEFLGRKEDADLVDFVDWVLSHGEHRFVLTTREHVLADALQRSEKLRHHGLADERCVVTVGDFGRSQRARILYNHLYFSSLPLAYRAEMLRDDFFLEVIDSDDFNPRIVEWLASERRLRSIAPDQYQNHVRALIQNPHEIWRHAFNHELSQAARDVLVARHSLTYVVVYADDLERAFESLHARSILRTNQRSTPAAWRAAMKELEGSFLEIRKGQVEFINPSVRDFISSVLQDDPEIAVDVIESAVRFNQLASIWEGSAPDGPFPAARSRIRQNQDALNQALMRLLEGPSLRWFQEPTGTIGRYVDSKLPSRLQLLFEMRHEFPEVGPVALGAVDRVSDNVGNGSLDIWELTGLVESAWENRHRGDWASVSPILEKMNSQLRDAKAQDWGFILELRTLIGDDLNSAMPDLDDTFEQYRSWGVELERENCSDRDDYETLQYRLENLHERYDCDFSTEIETISDILNELEDEPDPDVVRPDAGRLSFEEESYIDDGEIRGMFRTLT